MPHLVKKVNKRVTNAPKDGLHLEKKERNVRVPSYGECVRHAKKRKTCNLGYIIVSML